MNVVMISIDHYLQLLEAETDTVALRASKTRLRQILEARLATGRVVEIFEETSPRKESIAAQLARQHEPKIPWHNIHMTEAERREAGIYEALLNRPGSPDETMEFTIEHRIPEDEVRENHFAAQPRHQFIHGIIACAVQCAVGLVEQNNPRLHRQHARQRQPLF